MIRTSSGQSSKSKLGTPEKNQKKRSVDFSPVSYTNEAFNFDDKDIGDYKNHFEGKYNLRINFHTQNIY